jgi:membrane protease YdiL (CAAX protease family)
VTERALSLGVALAALGVVAQRAAFGGDGWLLVAVLLAALPLRLAPAARAVAVWGAALTLASATGLLWQLAMVLALGALALGAWLDPSLRPAAPWIGRVAPGPTLIVGGVTPVALTAWLVLLQPDLQDVVSLVAGLPLPVLVILGVGFALVNAALEETLWRGLLQPHLAVLFGPALAIGLQAASFGAQHAHGVPRGLVGVLLAGTWAVLLGLLRQHSRGLLAPFLAHVVADATVAVIVLGSASSQACQR